jgi:hypothetical protein
VYEILGRKLNAGVPPPVPVEPADEALIDAFTRDFM